MNFEKQIATIKDKQDLHAWVDKLPDGAKGLIILQLPSTEEDVDTMRQTDFGELTIAEGTWLAQSYIHWIFSNVFSK
jgi:hypothetical protein